MGFYLRKSIKVGPVRFNLSKSGIGVSGGVTGFRIGSGPRGNYIHMGRGGIYYRKTLPSGKGKVSHGRIPQQEHQSAHIGVQMNEIESGDVSQMAHSSSVGLLREINEKGKKL